MRIALSLVVGFGVTLAMLFVLRRMAGRIGLVDGNSRSEEHTSELQSH